MINSLGYTVFTPRISNWQNSVYSQKKIIFWSTLEAPSEKTVQLQELVMVSKVVVNNIFDTIHYYYNGLILPLR